ncbi:peptidylprolyl isomerase [Methylibium sp.]|uniref:peptidylprolyl isomerase n=1 Tax=Methylibium sp. TaxID=2067992 RepID=UPI003D122C29
MSAAAQSIPARSADYIVAIVDRELVTNSEVQLRLAALRREAAQGGTRLPPDDELRRQLLDTLIDERAQLSAARESGVRIDEPELDRTVANVAAQNRITLAQLRERLQRDGIDFARFRSNLRDQLLLERVREREVQNRIKISDSEVETLMASRASGVAPPEFNVAQVLIGVPEGASEAEVAQRRAIADKALERARGGEDFTRLVTELSTGSKEQGGALGLRSLDRLPDLFSDAVRDLRAGAVVPQVLQSGAGFHVLKVLDRRDGGMMVTQTRARHILLRTSAQLSQQKAVARLAEFKQQVDGGKASFAQLARENSEDGSAAQGGELGWASPGQFVPEFEAVMKTLEINQISEPLVSRFGVHLIQVLERRSVPVDRKQQREIARNVLREQKFESAYQEWARDVRARAYVEMREPPQ